LSLDRHRILLNILLVNYTKKQLWKNLFGFCISQANYCVYVKYLKDGRIIIVTRELCWARYKNNDIRPSRSNSVPFRRTWGLRNRYSQATSGFDLSLPPRVGHVWSWINCQGGHSPLCDLTVSVQEYCVGLNLILQCHI